MIGQGLRLFGLGRYFWDTLREINPHDVREELERPFRIGFFSRSDADSRALARALVGEDASERPTSGLSFNDADIAAVASAGALDLAFLLLDASEPDWSRERGLDGRLASLGCPVFLVLTHADRLSVPAQGLAAMRRQFPGHPPELIVVVDPSNAEATRRRLLGPVLDTVPNIRLALGRRFPIVRSTVADQLIRETSRVNAQTALIASLPALVPVLGFFLGGMADILILTKNQAMLVFKLAALYGRDLDHRLKILKEIAPVIGGAFVWRTMARTAVGMAPAPIAALPKASIGYFGTYVVGQSARYYYERGDRPPPEALNAFRDEARRLYASFNDALKERLTRRATARTT